MSEHELELMELMGRSPYVGHTFVVHLVLIRESIRHNHETFTISVHDIMRRSSTTQTFVQECLQRFLTNGDVSLLEFRGPKELSVQLPKVT